MTNIQNSMTLSCVVDVLWEYNHSVDRCTIVVRIYTSYVSKRKKYESYIEGFRDLIMYSSSYLV